LPYYSAQLIQNHNSGCNQFHLQFYLSNHQNKGGKTPPSQLIPFWKTIWDA
jgi:hypothetical protein